MKRVLMLMAAMLTAASAMADEVWDTDMGRVIYEDEIAGAAIWSYPADNGRRGWIYLPGLAGNYDNRSVHEGYWIEDGKGPCMVEIVGVDGRRSTNWGRVILVFDGPAFPTSWTALGGECFDDPTLPVRGIVP